MRVPRAKFFRKFPLAVAIVLGVAACGGEAAATPSPSPLASASPSGNASPTATFKLSPAGTGVTAQGTILVFARATSMTVELKITGLQGSSSHISHIHTGSCQQRGGIIFALNQVIADGQGNADVRTTLSVKFPPASGHWYVVVHAGPDMQASNAGYLLCGNLF